MDGGGSGEITRKYLRYESVRELRARLQAKRLELCKKRYDFTREKLNGCL